MTSRPVAALGIGILTLVSACATETAVTAQSADVAEIDESDAVREIEAILDIYDQVIAEMNLDLLLTIWADADDVSIVSPVSRIQSSEELEAFFQGLRDAYLEIDLQRSNVTIHTEGTAGWVAFDYTIDGVTADGPLQFSGWETQVYRRIEDGWRIAHIHYSVLLEQPAEP